MLRAGLLLLIASVGLADSEVGKTIRKTVSAEAVNDVSVEIRIAEMTIRTGPGKEIIVHGTIRREFGTTRGRQRATEIVNDTDIDVVVQGSRAFIREKLGPGARKRSARWVQSEVKLNITLPRNSDLDVEMNIGELEITGEFRNVTVEMNIGELTVKVPKKDIKELTAGVRIGEVHADLGERTISKEGILAGRTRYVSDTGDYVVDLSLDIGEIDVTLEE